MKRPETQLVQALTTIALGTFCSALIGYLFNGTMIFAINQPPARFLFLGLGGSLVYTLAVYRTSRAAFMALLGLFMIQTFLSGYLYLSEFVGRGLHYLAIFVAVLIYRKVYCRELGSVTMGKTFIMAGMVGFFFLVAALISGLLYRINSFDSDLYWDISQGFLLGLGLGAGLEIAHRYLWGKITPPGNR